MKQTTTDWLYGLAAAAAIAAAIVFNFFYHGGQIVW